MKVFIKAEDMDRIVSSLWNKEITPSTWMAWNLLINTQFLLWKLCESDVLRVSCGYMESLIIICPFQHKLFGVSKKKRNNREAGVAGIYRLLLEVRIVPPWIFHFVEKFFLPGGKGYFSHRVFNYYNFSYYYSFSICYFIWLFILFLSKPLIILNISICLASVSTL